VTGPAVTARVSRWAHQQNAARRGRRFAARSGSFQAGA